MKHHFTWKGYLDDLDQLYDMALGKENLTAALKIKDMQVKAHEREAEDLEKLALSEMSDDQIETLLTLLSENIQTEDVTSPQDDPGSA